MILTEDAFWAVIGGMMSCKGVLGLFSLKKTLRWQICLSSVFASVPLQLEGAKLTTAKTYNSR